ncbi:glutaredoxin-related protein 5, mitochondrial-like [Daphnia carinata]|uniref:glutaredoxin-related protein 5, mitochondrial-like n=1 Tax=Daphnia carinata TaxID=120202 RepID=UPI00257C54EE|nr:glutaredoxin-related protein 5, mitochondrial-like [Daphnia carinata]
MTTAIQRCSKALFQSVVLKKHLSVSRYSTVLPKEQFEQMVKKNKVVVFMKGVPEQPMCGFSNAVVQIFRMHGVTNYDAHNVLEDESMRQGIKEFTNWPTIPQIFIGGEFVGGCDILLQMHKNGELIEELQKVGIQSALIEQEDKKE